MRTKTTPRTFNYFMTSFFCKNLRNKPTAVSLLKENRIQQGLTIGTISKQLTIDPKFIANLEEAKYNRLPGNIYIRNVIKKYADFLKLDSEKILNQYEQERAESFKKTEIKHFIPVCQIKNSTLLIRKTIVASLGLFLVIYLGLEVWGIYKAPPLNLLTPTDGQITTESSLKVQGTTNPELNIKINGVETVSDNVGSFSENVILNPGSNQIIVTATKKHGRSQTIIYNVIYRETKEEINLNNL